MIRQAGLALAVCLVLLALLELLGLSGARLAIARVRIALDEAGRRAQLETLAARAAAASAAAPEPAPGASAGDASLQVLALTDGPPPPGSGYSAVHFRAAQLRISVRDAESAESVTLGVAVLHGAPADQGTAQSETGGGTASLDTDGDGAPDRRYSGDADGNAWRADLAGDPPQWRPTRLARLEGSPGVALAPDLVQMHDARGRHDALVLAGGDRLWLLRDRATGAGAVAAELDPADGWQATLGGPAVSAPLVFGRRIYVIERRDGRNWLRTLDLATGRFLGDPLEVGADPAPVLRYEGSRDADRGAPECSARLVAGERSFEAPACPRFRTAWSRSAGG